MTTKAESLRKLNPALTLVRQRRFRTQFQSWELSLSVQGTPNETTGMICNLSEVDAALVSWQRRILQKKKNQHSSQIIDCMPRHHLPSQWAEFSVAEVGEFWESGRDSREREWVQLRLPVQFLGHTHSLVIRAQLPNPSTLQRSKRELFERASREKKLHQAWELLRAKFPVENEISGWLNQKAWKQFCEIWQVSWRLLPDVMFTVPLGPASLSVEELGRKGLGLQFGK